MIKKNLFRWNKKWKTVIVGAGLSMGSVLFIQARTSSDSYFELSKNLELFANIFKELNTYYVDPIEPGKLTKVGIDAMLNDLDPYTNYITESDIEDYEFMTTGKYGGIGAALRKKEKETFIGEIYENSPAYKAGLHSGDKLISIDGKNVSDKSVDDISVLLKGSPGTKVKLKLEDAYTNAVVEKELTREQIEVSSVPYAGFVGTNKDIAYVKLTQFTQNCSRLVKEALDSLKRSNPSTRAVLLDLRGNPGGLLDEAVAVCNLFIDRGQLVVSTKGKDRQWDKNFNTEGAAWDIRIPLAVMVNGNSASASEIVAGTVQDLDRGVVVGSKSFGKGLVQTTRPIGYNARIKLTTAKYYTPSGRCIQSIDYSHRNADGIAGKFADSLIGAFKTKNGRKVLSGGGVTPDVNTDDEKWSPFVNQLYTKHFIHDYATAYARTHKSISSPEQFSLSVVEMNEFGNWISGKDFAYKSKTEIWLDSLTAASREDKVYESAKNEILALKNKIARDKKADFEKNKEELKRILENEIASRYHFQKGRILQGMQSDVTLKKAIDILSKPEEMKNILTIAK